MNMVNRDARLSKRGLLVMIAASVVSVARHTLRGSKPRFDHRVVQTGREERTEAVLPIRRQTASSCHGSHGLANSRPLPCSGIGAARLDGLGGRALARTN